MPTKSSQLRKLSLLHSESLSRMNINTNKEFLGKEVLLSLCKSVVEKFAKLILSLKIDNLLAK